MTRWSTKQLEWIRAQKFEHLAQQSTLIDYLGEVDHGAERVQRLERAIDAAILVASPTMKAVIEWLQALRGVAKLTATTIAVEVGCFSRFAGANRLMAYCGAVPSEYSSGASRRQWGITKTGNAHVRRVLFEAAWCNRHRPSLSIPLKKRRQNLSEPVKEIALKAQHRLYSRYVAMSARGKPSQKVIGAIGRELLGFIWAIAVQVEAEQAALPTQAVAA
jgi:transposase